MNYSLNEVDSTARKAARGAGFSWGLAEETGKAVRWLCSFGLPGVEVAADLLALNDGKPYETLAPRVDETPWRADAGDLCPIISGACLCDRADALAAGTVIEFGAVSHPLLLLPFASRAAAATATRLSLATDEGAIAFGPDGRPDLADADALRRARAGAVRVEVGHGASEFVGCFRTRWQGDRDAWSRLLSLAHRTYAPATEQSRETGAGAGRIDGD